MNNSDLESFAPPNQAKAQELPAPGPPPRRTVWTSFLSFIWDSDTHLKSHVEKRLLFKLDCAMLTCLCLGFFCKYLDQSNITNAYNSGMKESLGWTGNQFTYAQSLYTAAYAIMQIPSTLIVQKVRPSYWLAGCEIAWAAFTFAQAGVHSTSAMWGLRFMVGIFESAFFPTGLYLLGSWYTPTELAKRTGIFHMTAAAGGAFAGYMQAAVYTTLDGSHGMEGWRWLYIVCGVITLPCGILVFFILPNYPSSRFGKPWYLTDEEFEMAQLRMERVKRVQTSGLMNLTVLKSIFKRWHVYLLPLVYILYGQSCQNFEFFGIWLKNSERYGKDVVMINILPTMGKIVQIFFTVFWGFMSDYFGTRIVFIVGPMSWGAISAGILAAWPSSTNLKLFAFISGPAQYCTAIIYSFWSEICTGDPLERALVIGMSNGLQFATNAWLPILIFPQVEAPSFRKGFPTDFAFVILTIITALLVWFLYRRDLRNAVVDSPEEQAVHDKEQELDIPMSPVDVKN